MEKEQAGEEFNPIEAIMKFNEELHEYPEGNLSEADKTKIDFINEHPKWKKIVGE